MQIIISQQGKKLIAEFHHNKCINKYSLDKADGFLNAIDSFSKKRKMNLIGQIRHIKFSAKGGSASGGENTSILTERIIRAIIRGLRF